MAIPRFQGNPLFNAHHSPMGAYLTFTCGHPGTTGGLATESGKPGDQDIYIGIKNSGRYADTPLQVLPFFQNADKLDPALAYQPEKPGVDRERFSPYLREQIGRHYGYATDRWVTSDFEFQIYTPFGAIPDSAVGTDDQMRAALLPAITAELIIDNTNGSHAKTGFFAINFHAGGVRQLENLASHIAGFAHRHLGFAGFVVDLTATSEMSAPGPFLRFWPHEGLEDRSNPIHLLGTTPGLAFEVPAGKKYALRLALGCHVPQIVTTRIECRYLYAKYFSNIEDVLGEGLKHFCDLKKQSKQLDEKLLKSGLSVDQQFLIAHATRSYYANTQLLEVAATGEPYWIVNEGEYRMMNTLDLAVDQVFWELEQNPWVVRNLLDNFLKHYSYADEVKLSVEDAENAEMVKVMRTLPGGVSFTHDQGTHNQFSAFGTSAYELPNLTGTFSFMTQEQLCNWILIAASYLAKTSDVAWLKHNVEQIILCFNSMTARSALTHELLGAIMDKDTALCGTGSEITTYDSLDSSLGQAKFSLYLAIKCWASYLGLTLMFNLLNADESDPVKADVSRFGNFGFDAFYRARTIEKKIALQLNAESFLPALLLMDNGASRILPAVEAAVYPMHWAFMLSPDISWSSDWINVKGHGKDFFTALRTNTISLLSDPDHRNKFSDGGIKLSSTSDNSWLSKIAIVQHVARALFNLDENGQDRGAGVSRHGGGWERADEAHVKWLTTGPGAYWCACDQIVSGVARGSKYYPRLITTALWLGESEGG